MSGRRERGFPPYAYVPGGPWPHPTGDPAGHSWGRHRGGDAGGGGAKARALLEGARLFDAGYYWEAHEAWEGLWLALGRTGPDADAVKGLIKLAASGVKVRQRQPHGVVSHARRAAELFEACRGTGADLRLGLDLEALASAARRIAGSPPDDPLPPGAPVSRVFSIALTPGDGPAPRAESPLA